MVGPRRGKRNCFLVGSLTRVDAAMAGALWAEGYIFLRKVDHETRFETGWNQPGQLPGPQPE